MRNLIIIWSVLLLSVAWSKPMKYKSHAAPHYYRALDSVFNRINYTMKNGSYYYSNPTSENSDMITYDSTIAYTNASNNGQSFSLHWIVRITRPRNYFTTDTASRIVIMTMPGAGEVQTGNPSDTSFATDFGPHFFLNQGTWNGGILLGNGTHYPIYITPIQAVANTRPWLTLGLFRTLKAEFHPRGGRFCLGGLSQGSYEWTTLALYSNNVVGNSEGMDDMFCIVDLEGVGPDTFQTGIDWPNPSGFSTVAQHGVKMFGLEGTNDTRNVWQLTQPMNTAVPNSGYFSFQNLGGGAHCCWNSMYDPTVLNWQCLAPITNANIVSFSNPANTMGNYILDKTNGSSIFQWMLRQASDTSIIGGCNPLVSMGGTQTIFLPTTSTVLSALIAYQCGNLSGTIGWSRVSGPNAPTIVTPTASSTSVTGLTVGTYVFQISVTDNKGFNTINNITVIVNNAIPPTVTTGGPYSITLPTNSVSISATALLGSGTSITSTTWIYVSGPTGSSIASPSSLSTVINGLVQGTYSFRMTAIDNNGNSGSAMANITVNPSGTVTPNIKPIIVGPGEYQCGFLDVLGKYGFKGAAYGLSSNLNNIGSGGAGTAGLLQRFVTTPANLKMVDIVGGLHGLDAIDSLGRVWAAGDAANGQIGNGVSTGSQLTPALITTDSLGNTIPAVAKVIPFFAGNTSPGYYFLTTIGTVYIVGQADCGMRGDGTAGGMATRPVQIPIPGGRIVKQLIAGYHAIILCTDNSIWVTGGGLQTGPLTYTALGYTPTNVNTDYLSWHQVTLPAGSGTPSFVAGGIFWDYVITSTKLVGWGFYGNDLGFNTGGLTNAGGGTPVPLPIELTNLETVLMAGGRTITDLQTNSETSYALLSDSTAYAWGGNAQGTVGNGQELNYADTNALKPSGSTLYSFNLGTPGVLLVTLPTQITNRKFISLNTGNSFVFYIYLEQADGTLLAFGRNKGSVIANGVVAPTSDINAAQSNAWDVPWPQIVNPFTLTQVWLSSSPKCVFSLVDVAPLTSTPCSEYPIPANTGPTSRAGSTQNITTNFTILDGTASTDNVHIVYGTWKLVSGPGLVKFDMQSNGVVLVSNLGTGTYVFSYTVIDNGWLSNVSSVTVNVNTSANCSCYFITF